MYGNGFERLNTPCVLFGSTFDSLEIRSELHFWSFSSIFFPFGSLGCVPEIPFPDCRGVRIAGCPIYYGTTLYVKASVLTPQSPLVKYAPQDNGGISEAPTKQIGTFLVEELKISYQWLQSTYAPSLATLNQFPSGSMVCGNNGIIGFKEATERWHIHPMQRLRVQKGVNYSWIKYPLHS